MPKDKFELFNAKVKLKTPHKPWRGKSILIKWPGWKNPLTINVYPHTEYNVDNGGFDMIVRYEVSWSAMGSVDFLQARRYAYAINLAATEASLLTEKYKGKEYK